ncbi:GCN5 family acetyltransferase [Thioclava dalianensis]|uniref:GCN5 family acetyltransferase n=1 Tax=Thioclava dalianensis TaxID=1185766 RepID=A0A074TLH0_9RHOB|nr:GNAT family N-acetyltransferase [Thioclava dalianensis]KEP69828.1 GCN5 family acetyltransferase [Thioclava dalianensis]SFM86997.1 Protein N-acetyltransferase, RimJ/RimL family [Thioclava dalianensis]
MTVALTPTPILETERLVLRAPQARDWEAWRDFFLTERGQWIRSMSNPSPKDAWRTFAAVTGHWVLHGCGMFVLTERGSDQGFGAVGPWMPVNWPEAEISWSLWSPQAEGKGYMAEAARAVIAHAFEDLNWSTAVSYIDPNNTRSTALAKRLGATPDPDAAFPGDPPITVWRHPAPKEVAA